MTSETGTIHTDRLTLRPLHPSDAGRIALLAGDYDVAAMSAAIPYPYSEQQAAAWIGEVLAGEEGVVFAIAQDARLVGCAGYRPHDAAHAEIGYWIGKPFWGRGYATEAVRALIADAFRRFGFDYLLGGHFVDNTASARVIAKLGFAPFGEEIRDSVARDSDVRVMLYRLTRAEAGFAPPALKEARKEA